MGNLGATLSVFVIVVLASLRWLFLRYLVLLSVQMKELNAESDDILKNMPKSVGVIVMAN